MEKPMLNELMSAILDFTFDADFEIYWFAAAPKEMQDAFENPCGGDVDYLLSTTEQDKIGQIESLAIRLSRCGVEGPIRLGDKYMFATCHA